ncbi:methyltransferase [Geomesophilobacter sediminis]|uniref:Methyltransferase domain-containing protein n=1 Tax=Geomesophilobacter sediminis TaxID=2798584 RepID=A0A8J7ISJ4_9BACT|nr:methyltransferase [Geomesophilobacter sediminis]MBJ6726289.1 methyltransferase domain-containing protein [Geomesophilobacter sediminis]
MENRSWTPAQLLELSGSYWSTCALHAAVKLKVFTCAATPQAATEIARKCGCDLRGLTMLLNAMCGLGLMEKSGDTYVNTPFANEYLSQSSPKYLGHIIMHHHHLVASWGRLDEAVRTGSKVRVPSSHDSDPSEQESFLMGMFNLAMQLAPKIVPQIDLKGRRRLLDLGGGPGTYAIHFCRENPELSAVICDLPTTRAFAEKTVASFGLSDRIEFVARDFDTDELPRGFDVAWLSHILHSWGPEGCRQLLKKAVKTLEPGGLILVQEFVLDDTKDGPLFPTLFSLNMLIGTSQGQAYSEGELKDLLSEAGVTYVRRIPLQLPNGSGVIGGVVKG